ncbi:hypothetical protein [Azohydromonas lata]|uniref:Phasin domain-containing protein n=1 Tax=Azohydromonas lata TaxID=45677 RepID=A0ABU5IFL9_9BURK|nr:hypothetical protein [Azohydromonas lata]MDZ5457894.1 hypothetical protein [Azohydromonas lata]
MSGPTKPAPRRAASPNAAAMRDAYTRSKTLRESLGDKLLPLLALCQFATSAHETLHQLDRAAAGDAEFVTRLDMAAPAWLDAMGQLGAMPGRIGECLALAMTLCSEAAGNAQAVAEVTYSASRDLCAVAPAMKGGAA